MIGSFWLDDGAATLTLDGEFAFQLGDAPPRTLPVPSAWEAHLTDKTTDGPARYRRDFDIPADWLTRHIRLEAGAISYHATIRVNGQLAGTHSGMWSPFQLDITPFVRAGRNEIEIEAWKPGNRFPVRSTLAGFLPDVCNTFGGVWQSVRLRAFSGAAFTDLRLHADDTGRLRISGAVWSEGPITHVIVEAGGATARAEVSDGRFSLELTLTDVRRWRPGTEDARLVPITVSAHLGGRALAARTQRIGFRTVRAVGEQTLFNDQPFHFRGVLDWGWNPQTVAPVFTRETIRENYAKARALGFNLWKLCLYVPDETLFDIADEFGMPLWLEMPLWLPRITPEFKTQALRAYESIFRRVQHHPSIAIVSLGCELNAQADTEFLRALHTLAREWFPNVLLCDNSGSAEAYGGVDVPLSDFRDYHFYADPHFFEPLIQHFHRGYRAVKPWLYGEFCDADTLRDYNMVSPETWWLHTGTTEHPDHLPQREHRKRLAEAGITDGGRSLTGIARPQATAIRKHILELVRRHNASGGYVVTGWRDTPIATSGVVDDTLQLKFESDEWRAFNNDVVLTIDRERRRRWEGGDRPSPRDPYTWWQGERVGLRVIVSNGGGELESGELAWAVTRTDGEPVASGMFQAEGVPGGTVIEIGVIDFMMPTGQRPVELILRASLTGRHQETPHRGVSTETVETGRWPVSEPQNQWNLWAIPKPKLPPALAVEPPLLYRHRFDAIEKATRFVEIATDGNAPIIASELTGSLIARVHDGARVLLWLTQPDSRFTVSAPFWRWAIHVFEPHPLWESVPHAGHADMRFFSVATDFALDAPKLVEVCAAGDSPSPKGRGGRGVRAALRAIWRRFDAIQLTWADYVLEVALGSGYLLVTTLRLEGGLGSQPATFQTNPWGAWLLAAFVNHLSKMQP